MSQFVGDEVLALFGIPGAYEDDPVRAVRAAERLHELARDLSPEVEGKIGRLPIPRNAKNEGRPFRFEKAPFQTMRSKGSTVRLEALPEHQLEYGRGVIVIRVSVESNGETPVGDAHPLAGAEGIVLEADVEV